MHLDYQDERRAHLELLSILYRNPEGKRTSELSDTPKFHGERTLTADQIRRILRKSGCTREQTGGSGMRTFTCWTLLPEKRESVYQELQVVLEDKIRRSERLLKSAREELAAIQAVHE